MKHKQICETVDVDLGMKTVTVCVHWDIDKVC